MILAPHIDRDPGAPIVPASFVRAGTCDGTQKLKTGHRYIGLVLFNMICGLGLRWATEKQEDDAGLESRALQAFDKLGACEKCGIIPYKSRQFIFLSFPFLVSILLFGLYQARWPTCIALSAISSPNRLGIATYTAHHNGIEFIGSKPNYMEYIGR